MGARCHGHYAGRTSQGEPISFDVTRDGDVTNVIASVRAGTQSDVLTVAVRFGVTEDGCWGGTVSSDGVTCGIEGDLGADGDARGTLFAEFARSELGVARGEVAISWFARRVPAPERARRRSRLS